MDGMTRHDHLANSMHLDMLTAAMRSRRAAAKGRWKVLGFAAGLILLGVSPYLVG